jgi:uncharacterized protein (DUF486 family)
MVWRAETCIARNARSLAEWLAHAKSSNSATVPHYAASQKRHYDAPEAIVRTILLLTISNIFMTFAWYGHLKYRSEALWKVILASWGVAFFEYCFQVPANRIGSYEFTTAQLKTIQEVITLAVFSVFSIFYLGEKLKWNYAAGFGCIALAVFFVFRKW